MRTKAPFLAGRILFGGFFLYNGINHFVRHGQMKQYASSKGVPAPGLAISGTGLALIAGGASLVTGVKPKLGAAAIAGFLAGVSPKMHDFWRVHEPNQRMVEMINFSKNLALLGAALALMEVKEPWRASIESARQPHGLRRVGRAVRGLLAA
jgi:putative oxidoreductase